MRSVSTANTPGSWIPHLADLVVRGQRYLYRRRTRFGQSLLAFCHRQLSQCRKGVKRVCSYWSVRCFTCPLSGFAWALSYQPDLIYSLMPPKPCSTWRPWQNQPDNITWARPATRAPIGRCSGFYIRNNIGVAFRTCASGLYWCGQPAAVAVQRPDARRRGCSPQPLGL